MAFVTIGKENYHYRFSDKAAEGEITAVFIHGSGADGSVWEYQRKGLADFCRIVIPDLPGHGKSGGNVPASTREYAEWLDCFSAELKLSSFVLVGHSLGGAVAQVFACICPEKVKGLVLAGTGMTFSLSDEYLQVLQNDFEAAVKISCDNAYGPSVSQELYQKGRKMLLKNGKEALYEDMLICAEFDCTKWISTVRTPGLVVCGEEDQITLPELSRALSQALPESELKIISGSGHMVMNEAADEFNDAIKDFMKGKL